MCGKNGLEYAPKVTASGSPPRVREKQDLNNRLDNCIGITPACAGKTTLTFLARSLKQDHPRVCGKNGLEYAPKVTASGSPPRVREKQDLNNRLDNCIGITPACAGKTTLTFLARSLKQDHPRVCGKNGLEYAPKVTASGSPPRVREKQDLNNRLDNCIGITPACAGKTTLTFLARSLKQDHPRVCGKNSY